uniref:Uncharacterized protein n=1 Tax=Timema monikensis TaxID=170555 RepID=A0A7R9EF59_9NEOP|nr:unnamed protein product [Timema monikensis]
MITSEPSKEMKAAMKVLSDSLVKPQSVSVPNYVKNATNIIQQEWFQATWVVEGVEVLFGGWRDVKRGGESCGPRCRGGVKDKCDPGGRERGVEFLRVREVREVAGIRGSAKSCGERCGAGVGEIGGLAFSSQDYKHTGVVDTRLFPEGDVASEELRQRLMIGLLVALYYSNPLGHFGESWH